MKIIEEKYLKNKVKQLNKYVKEHSNFLDFFNDIDSFIDKPLQEVSFKGDLEFLDEIGFIISVITSIVAKPLINSKDEEILIRSELAPAITPDMFNKTMKDPTIWSDSGLEMVPEHIYYHQHVDEIATYENIFICYLLKLIDAEITKYYDFYYSMIKTFNELSNDLDNEKVNIAFNKINILIRRIKYIKSTYFYKTVNKHVKNNIVFHPTNILTKNKLYNHCYKFYKRVITYSDEVERNLDVKIYFFTLFVKVCKEMNFTIVKERLNKLKLDEDNKFIVPGVKLTKDNFSILLYPSEEYNGLCLIVENTIAKENNKSKHLLVFNSKSKFDDINIIDNNFDTIEAMSVWNTALIDDNNKLVYSNYVNELDMMRKWIQSKLYIIKCDYNLYSKYCPSCKSNQVDDNLDLFVCEECNSLYTFYKNKNNEDILWFKRLRNKI